MAKIDDNPLVKGARGNFGRHYVYKKRGNDTHIARMPAVNKDAVPTDKQEEVRDLFAAASQYAKGVIADADLKKEYQKKAPEGVTAYNMAFRDYLKAPKVKSIDARKYNGTPGSTIDVKAMDDFRVAEVKISIYSAAGSLVEEGNAVLNPIKRSNWTYTATQTNAALAGSRISATASDLPGNEGMLEITI